MAAANSRLPGSAALPAALLQGWVCRLGVALHRQNAAMVRRCVGVDGDYGLDKTWSEGPPALWELPCMTCASGESFDDHDDAGS